MLERSSELVEGKRSSTGSDRAGMWWKNRRELREKLLKARALISARIAPWFLVDVADFAPVSWLEGKKSTSEM